MRFRRRLSTAFAIVAGVACVLCACGKEANQEAVETTPSPTPTEEPLETLYFWYSDESIADYINSAALTFGEENGVRVIAKQIADSEYLEAINKVTLQEEQAPDAYIISNDSLEKAYLAGLAAPINDNEGIMNTTVFPRTALDAVTYKGKQVAYPLFFETSAFLYNETYLREWAMQQAKKEAESVGIEYDEATLTTRCDEIMASVIPVTMDELLNMANNFEAPEMVEAIFKWDVSDIFYNYYIVGNYMIVGGDTGDDKTNIHINNPETIACLEVYKALNQFFYIESDSVSYESVIQDFIDGKLVFTIATTDVVAALEQAKQEGNFAYDYGIALLPHPGKELKGRSLSVTNAIAINGYSQKKELANRFAAFLADGYIEELYFRTGKVPANLKAETENGALQIFKEEYASSVSLPKMIETGNFWIQLEILFSKVWNGEDVQILVSHLAAQIESQVSANK